MTSTPWRRRVAVVVAVPLALGGLAACASASGSSSGSTSTPGATASAGSAAAVDLGSASVGQLTITGAYIPAPASPSVAGAYMVISNAGDAPDTLMSVSTTAAASTQMHQDVKNGNADTMVPITSLPIPAHGSAAFSVGTRHIMLMNPTTTLVEGQKVTLTVTFASAGAVSIVVPVVAATGPQDGMSSMDMGSASAMPGMS